MKDSQALKHSGSIKTEFMSDSGSKLGSTIPLTGSTQAEIRLMILGYSGEVKLFQMEWNYTEFMRRQFGDYCSASIESTIVLTGDSKNAQATTCRDYLRKHWPRTYARSLEFLKHCTYGGTTSIKPIGTCPHSYLEAFKSPTWPRRS